MEERKGVLGRFTSCNKKLFGSHGSDNAIECHRSRQQSVWCSFYPFSDFVFLSVHNLTLKPKMEEREIEKGNQRNSNPEPLDCAACALPLCNNCCPDHRHTCLNLTLTVHKNISKKMYQNSALCFAKCSLSTYIELLWRTRWPSFAY